ncbi:hypothetical protein NDU88_008398 [Pleurodeles waltl]|uniref:Uncharacterized protein n=1 Tax=Pleurodeles waltl TaxID=8319 RepID=A0AAV7N4V7_PLEWA|nr:hypothetical protein NDU88_008398 [Pleurodeles waltl]
MPRLKPTRKGGKEQQVPGASCCRLNDFQFIRTGTRAASPLRPHKPARIQDGPAQMPRIYGLKASHSAQESP